MNKENYPDNLELSPLKIDDIDDTISELATISEFEKLDDLPDDLVDTIINLNI